MKTSKFYHRFSYPRPLRGGEVPKPSKVRDGAAFDEIAAPLTKFGYEFGQIIFNPPADSQSAGKTSQAPFSFIKPADLIVLTTRPPLDDLHQQDKKHLTRSGTHLENQIFAEFRKYFAASARSHMELTPEIGRNFDKADLSFHQNQSARLKSFSGLDSRWRRRIPDTTEIAIGFFLRTPSIPVYGCGLLACFSMGGWETLLWNRLVRTRYPDWLKRPAFIIGQFDMEGIPAGPSTLEFVDRIKVEILLERPIDAKGNLNLLSQGSRAK